MEKATPDGSAVSAWPVHDAKPQRIYDKVVDAACCAAAVDPLACLGSISTETLIIAMSAVQGIF